MDCGYGVKETNQDNKAIVAIQANDLYNGRDKFSGTSLAMTEFPRLSLGGIRCK
jgi:hypothetical protein